MGSTALSYSGFLRERMERGPEAREGVSSSEELAGVARKKIRGD